MSWENFWEAIGNSGEMWDRGICREKTRGFGSWEGAEVNFQGKMLEGTPGRVWGDLLF